MANVGTGQAQQNSLLIVGVAGVDDNDVVIELEDAARFDTFYFMSVAGLLDVDVSLDGTNFVVAIALTDEQSLAPATKVIITAAGLLYSFRGNFKTVRVRQNTATDAAGSVMICGKRV